MRESLKRGFEESGSCVNPLLLIQIPDRQAGELFDRENEIVQILNTNHGISVENGKLAIYLSENKENLENITRNDSEAEVMIFKQAIALGWDCPRASLLCLFRDWQNFVFSTQTLGRILRMPELKHYENEELNTAYVYTTVSDLSVLEDVASDYLTIQHAARKLKYEPLALRSVHSKRRRERTRLNPEFFNSLAQATRELDLKDNLDIMQRTVTRTLLVDGRISDADEEIEDIRDGDETAGYQAGQMERLLGNEEIQRLFDQFCAQTLAPQFFPEARSVGRVKTAIYQFFHLSFSGQFKKLDSEIQKIVLDRHNMQKMIDAINRAKEIYLAALDKEEKELLDHVWEVTPSFDYNASYTRKEFNKSIMQPFFERNDAPTGERSFAKYLDENEAVQWWYKNGDRDQTFFAIPYEINGEPFPFYVDWIVKFADGRIGLFDTKAGITAASVETKAKAEGLQRYIQEENEKGKNLIGGVVLERGESWRVNDNPEYLYNEDDLREWKFFENL
jgi:type III restriction enzyme